MGKKTVPQDWKDSCIVSIHKKKGDKSICGNSRGLSMLSLTGKILARASNQEHHRKETQCGFRMDRPTSDMIFVLRQLQEKAREQNKDLFIAFINLAKAFGSWTSYNSLTLACRLVWLWVHLNPPSFPVQVGVKQGCVLAPVIFNLFLAAVTLLFRNSLSPNEGVCLQFRLDGNLFNLRRLQAITKTTTTHELKYADICAFLAHSLTATRHTVTVLIKSLLVKHESTATSLLPPQTQKSQSPDPHHVHFLQRHHREHPD